MALDADAQALEAQRYSEILVERDGAVAVVTLNRPERLNAISRSMLDELTDAFASISEDPGIRVVVIKGAGRSFSAGADLRQKPAPKPPYAVEMDLLLEQKIVLGYAARFRRMLWETPQPVICQLHGYCMTLSVELAMNCDLVYVSTDAKIAWRSNGGSGRYIHLWPWLIGPRRTKELLFTGRFISGEEAAEVGMVNAALPAEELEGHVRSVADQLTRVPPSFLALDKQACNACLDLAGARFGGEIAAVLHGVSHLTGVSHEQAETIHSAEWREAVMRRNARYRPDGDRR